MANAGVVIDHLLGAQPTLYWGTYRCSGTVDDLGVPGQYLVLLFDRLTCLPIRSTVSSADGAYAFTGIPDMTGRSFVVAFDHGANPVNAAISDQLVFEPLP
jgi:hypothetical protein